MGTPNISAVLGTSDLEEIKAKVTEIKNKLAFLVNIEPDDKKSYFNMGAKSVSFVEAALRTAKNQPDIIPPSINVSEFEKDVNLTVSLSDLAAVIDPLQEAIRDTFFVVGSEAMAAANLVYGQVKLSSKTDVNLDEAKRQLGQRYKSQGKKKDLPKNN